MMQHPARNVCLPLAQICWVNTLQDARDKAESILAAALIKQCGFDRWPTLTREEQRSCHLSLHDQALICVDWCGRMEFRAGMPVVHIAPLEFLSELVVRTILRHTPYALELGEGRGLFDNPGVVELVSMTAPVDHYASKLHELWMVDAKNMIEHGGATKDFEEKWLSLFVPYAELGDDAREGYRKQARFLLELEDK